MTFQISRQLGNIINHRIPFQIDCERQALLAVYIYILSIFWCAWVNFRPLVGAFFRSSCSFFWFNAKCVWWLCAPQLAREGKLSPPAQVKIAPADEATPVAANQCARRRPSLPWNILNCMRPLACAGGFYFWWIATSAWCTFPRSRKYSVLGRAPGKKANRNQTSQKQTRNENICGEVNLVKRSTLKIFLTLTHNVIFYW